MLSLLLSACIKPIPPAGPPVHPDVPELRAVLLADVGAVASLGEGAAEVLRLQAGQVVRVHAQSAYPSPLTEQDTWTLGYPIWLIESDSGTGWVSGEHLAVEHLPVEQSWRSTDWPGEVITRQLGQSSVWSAAQVGREWSDGSWERTHMRGWLVVQGPQDTQLLEVVDSNEWGAGRSIDQVVWRDLTGDGQDEAMLVIQETVTEAGSVGRTLRVFDFTQSLRTPMLEIPVRDPHWSGLDTVNSWGWLEVDLPQQQVVARWVERGACPATGQQQPAAERPCLSHNTQRWSWASGEMVQGPVQQTALRAHLEAGEAPLEPPTWGALEQPGEQRSLAAGPVCVGQVEGPVGVGDVIWMQALDCEGGVLGWVESTALRYGDPVLDEILGEWPEQEQSYVKFVWE